MFLLSNEYIFEKNQMKYYFFEVPTMQGMQSQEKINHALKELRAVNTRIERGKVHASFPDGLRKVDVLIAIENAGHVVKY